LLDHEPSRGWCGRQESSPRAGLTFLSAQITDVPGQTLTFPTLLAASGVKYLASGPNPERAVPLLPPSGGSEGTAYPQLYYWEGPDGSRVRIGARTTMATAPALALTSARTKWAPFVELAARSAGHSWPRTGRTTPRCCTGGLAGQRLMKEALVANVQEFGRRFTWPRIVTGRSEDFFRDVERRFGSRIPVKRGDTGLYWKTVLHRRRRSLLIPLGAARGTRRRDRDTVECSSGRSRR